MRGKGFLTIVVFFISGVCLYSNVVNFAKIYGSSIWSPNQNISGTITLQNYSGSFIYINNERFELDVDENSHFSFNANLVEQTNKIYVQVDSAGVMFNSDTLELNLSYKLQPEVEPSAVVNGSEVTLTSEIIANPKNSNLTFIWNEDPGNPSTGFINNIVGESVTFGLPAEAPNGEYYYDLYVITSDQDTVKFRTLVTKKGEQVLPFNIRKDRAKWIDEAIIYQVTPYNFVLRGKFEDITQKLEEINELGINTLYLQPTYSTHFEGQGYDVTDYFGIRSDYGDEQSLRELINKAKSLGMRVIFDFVINHSSYYHPFAEHSREYGENSYYYDFYQRELSNSPYGSEEKFYNGFVYYFDWTHLPNLNHNKEDVKNYIFEAAKYWIREFGVDGYRFDAVWATTGRTPSFVQELRLALKRIKPEVLMLGEDKATQDQAFDERFDVAYDWAPEYWWVSHWSWQTTYDPNYNRTIFNNTTQSRRCGYLRNALTNNGNGFAENASVLHFMENNDVFRFLQHHTLEQTRMVAALLMSLNGVPLMYNGQEIGFKTHPYSTQAIYLKSLSMKSNDRDGLFDYYKKLISIRKKYEALTSNNFEEVNLNSNTFVYGFRRWTENQNVFCLLNLSSNQVDVTLNLPLEDIIIDSSKTYYLTDLLDASVIQGNVEELTSLKFTMNSYEYKMFLFADSIETVTPVEDESKTHTAAVDYALQQNYPNPFNPVTTITFSLPSREHVTIEVFDVIGQKIKTLVDQNYSAGTHEIKFDGSDLVSGIYLYTLRTKNKLLTNKMILMK